MYETTLLILISTLFFVDADALWLRFLTSSKVLVDWRTPMAGPLLGLDSTERNHLEIQRRNSQLLNNIKQYQTISINIKLSGFWVGVILMILCSAGFLGPLCELVRWLVFGTFSASSSKSWSNRRGNSSSAWKFFTNSLRQIKGDFIDKYR